MKRRRNRSAHQIDPGGSFDVLLQLTLPVALILAFVVVTQLKQFINLYKLAVDTPVGVVMQQTKEAILTLQEQLLLKASREVFEEEATGLYLDRYTALIPTADQIVDHALSPDFVTLTRKLYDRFGTQKRHSDLQAKMGVRALNEKFVELVNQQAASHPGLGATWLAELREVSSDNKAKLDKSVAGEMSDLFNKAAKPQDILMVDWIRSKRATDASGDAIRKAWDEFIIAGPADRQSRSNRFVNLKVLALQQILNSLNAPLLEEAVNEVL